MVYDSSFLLTVKDRVTEKLKTLGAFIDDELPDYIMVMVANKKSESAMAKDLQLFLGEHTNKFTEWLHHTLEGLKVQGLDFSDGRRDSDSIRSSRSKSGRRKARKSRSSDSVTDSSPKFLNRSRSRSPMGPSKRARFTNSSREPHGEMDDSVKAAADVYISDGNESHPVKEERKVMSTSSLSRKLVQDNEKSPDLLDKTNNLQSVVEVKNSESHRHTRTRPEHSQPSSLLLKRAVNEAKASTLATESSLNTQAKRKPITRPVACSDVSSSSQPDSTRFFITLSGAEPNSTQIVTSPKIRNASRVGRLRSVGYFDQTNVLNDRKLRLGSRIVDTTPLHKERRISAKRRLGPVIQSNARIVSLSRNDENFDYNSGNEFDDLVEGDYVELACDDTFIDDGVDENLPLKGNYVPLSKMNLNEKLNQQTPQLVVNLNETDEDEDIATLLAEAERHKKNFSIKRKENVQNAADIPTETGTQPTIPSSLERCKFWPNCRNGSSCPYIHPTEPCQLFPRCKFGETCTFVHPPCRYGALCSRADCQFSHSSKKVLPVLSANPAQIVCRFQNRCANPHCQFYHPPVVVQPPIIVRSPMPNVPVFTSTIPCRYGSACTNRPKCPFLHSDLPSVDQLKWIAPSKKQQSSNPVSTNTHSTVKSAITSLRDS
ncbi:hypothetical protein MN116_006749 [Schistosoma mekongi]|uniref:Zinc finger CCCH domain-containing protein 14 n=1 Tax=Schistosoma mekongi TaxID=38744 RepID=A0AAE1Z8M8_SCHME|nr:hypothetical protein MN116_006749 [Schistosoma mekongi]